MVKLCQRTYRLVTSDSSFYKAITPKLNHRIDTSALRHHRVLRSLSDAVRGEQKTVDGFTRRFADSWPEEDLLVLPEHLRPVKGETLDLILRQKVYILQSRRGYRANIDSHILAFFASEIQKNHGAVTDRPLRFLDLGAGNGLVSLLFARANMLNFAHLVELQPQLAERAKRNLELNEVCGEVTQHDLVGGDLPDNLRGNFDVILMNPPFYPQGTRTGPQGKEKYLSHLETSASLLDFLKAARKAINDKNPDAFVAVIHDTKEASRLAQACHDAQLHVHGYRQMQHAQYEAPTRVVVYLKPARRLYEKCRDATTSRNPAGNASASSQGLILTRCLPPIILHPDQTNPNVYCDEVEAYLERLPTPVLRIGRLRDVATT